jgi:hypothetical protein
LRVSGLWRVSDQSGCRSIERIYCPVSAESGKALACVHDGQNAEVSPTSVLRDSRVPELKYHLVHSFKR